MPVLLDVKNYFFAFLFDFMLFGAFATLFATFIFGTLYFYNNRIEVKRSFEEKKALAQELSHRLPEMQQAVSSFKYYDN